MPNKKLTDSEIVKALNEAEDLENVLLYCKNPNKEVMIPIKITDIRDLINRLQAEIERLSDRNLKCIYLSDDETTEYCVDGPCPKYKTEAQIKTETHKEFAEKLLSCYKDFDDANEEITLSCLKNTIEDCLKEESNV